MDSSNNDGNDNIVAANMASHYSSLKNSLTPMPSHTCPEYL